MPLVLSAEAQMVRDTALDFFRERSPITALRKLRDDNDPVGILSAAMAGDGRPRLDRLPGRGRLWRVGIRDDRPRAGHGGVRPYLGRVAAAVNRTAWRITAVIGGSAEQKARYLPPLVGGEHLFALALEEGSRHEPARILSTAERDGAGYRLTGKKTFVLDGHIADTLIVAARTAAGITLFLVPGDAAGLTRTRLSMVDSRNAAKVTLDDVTVGPDAVLGRLDAGADVLDAALDRARAGLAAEMLGSASEAFERTVQYLKDRKQFGVAIGSFQALKHRAAQMFCEVEMSRSAMLAAVSALDQGGNDAAALASLAKAKANETFFLCGNEGVQMHGGIGMTDEHEIGFFTKRARVALATFGDTAFCRARYAQLMGY